MTEGKREVWLVKPSRSNACHVNLTGTGRLAYLWIGDAEDRHLATVIGPAALHRIARAILNDVPHPRRKPKKPEGGRNG